MATGAALGCGVPYQVRFLTIHMEIKKLKAPIVTVEIGADGVIYGLHITCEGGITRDLFDNAIKSVRAESKFSTELTTLVSG